MKILAKFMTKCDPVYTCWNLRLRLQGFSTLRGSFLGELSRYYSMPMELVERLCSQATFEIEAAWRRANVLDNDDIRNFYRDEKWYPFELMEWHTAVFERSFLDIVLCSSVAKKLGLLDYLDYGCGIGSHGIYLASEGFNVTVADISSKALEFCRWRFQCRGLNVTVIDLWSQEVIGQYDFITLLDVFEHLLDPFELLGKVVSFLKPSGLLVVSLPDIPLPYHSMHFPYYSDQLRADAQRIGLLFLGRFTSAYLFTKPRGFCDFREREKMVESVFPVIIKDWVRIMMRGLIVPISEQIPKEVWRHFLRLTWIPIWLVQTLYWYKLDRWLVDRQLKT